MRSVKNFSKSVAFRGPTNEVNVQPQIEIGLKTLFAVSLPDAIRAKRPMASPTKDRKCPLLDFKDAKKK